MNEQKDLTILWASADEWSAHYLVMQYAISCITQDWWDSVTVVIWGESAKLLAQNQGLQERMKMATNVGVRFSACSANARQLGVDKQLSELGIELKGWGLELSHLIQQKAHLLTV